MGKQAGTSRRAGHREAMAKVDTAWLRMEKPGNPMMITGVLVFATPIDHARLRQVLEARFLAFRRFRQKAVHGDAGAWWQDDEDFDIDRHLRRAALPGEGGRDALEQRVSELASTPLEHARPLWQFELIERYGTGSALIVRIHHCYADGIALVQVMLSLTDVSAEPGEGSSLAEAWLKDEHHRVAHRIRAPRAPVRGQLDWLRELGSRIIDKGAELYRDPAAAALLAREGSAIAAELAHVLALADDPPTRLRGELGTAKHCAWAEPLPLDEVKAVGRALDCTVNDVLLACAAGALRGYLLDQGDDVDGLTIRATVPVNLRPLEHARQLGNRFGLVFLDLPIGEANPVRRLERVAASMRELKGSKQAIVAFGLLAVLGMSPAPAQRAALELLSRKASTVATNVPGPQMPLFLAGARIAEMMFWVPQTGGIGVGVSILSYNGQVWFGLMADHLRITDPRAVIARFRRQFDTLLYAVLMEDWQQPVRAADCAATLAHYAPDRTRNAHR